MLVRCRPEGAGFVAIVTDGDGVGRALARGDSEESAGDAAVADAAEALSKGTVSRSFLWPRAASERESYDDFLRWHGLLGPAQGFGVTELVRPGSRRHVAPPRKMWQAMVPTLAAAVELRRRVVSAGGRGLIVAAAYRPEGGAADSRHKHNAALDLDLFAEDRRLAAAYLRIAARFFAELAAPLNLGMGTYHPEPAAWTRRVHLDAGTRDHDGACWQIHDGGYITPPALRRLAAGEET